MVCGVVGLPLAQIHFRGRDRRRANSRSPVLYILDELLRLHLLLLRQCIGSASYIKRLCASAQRCAEASETVKDSHKCKVRSYLVALSAAQGDRAAACCRLYLASARGKPPQRVSARIDEVAVNALWPQISVGVDTSVAAGYRLL